MALRITFADGEDSIAFAPSADNDQRFATALAEIAVEGESTLDTCARWFCEQTAAFVCRYERRAAAEVVPLDNSILE